MKGPVVAIGERAVNALAALELPGVGAASVRRILRSDNPRWDELADQCAWERARQRAAATIEACSGLGLHVSALGESDYPRLLAAIEDAPPILYGRGAWDAVAATHCVAVVGTRECSDAGASAAGLIARELGRSGFAVVSGLARGIDTCAHEGALTAGAPTVAVLAHGLHMVSPAGNRDLAERIIESGGLLLSEHPPGVPPRRPEFVRRNRIQSGVSLCSVVVETGGTGGAVHQARFTHRQGRGLFVVRSRDVHSGLNQEGAELLHTELGASVVYSVRELLDQIAALAGTTRSEIPPQAYLFG